MTATVQLACWAALATVGAVLAPPVDGVVSVGPFMALVMGSSVGLSAVLLLAGRRLWLSPRSSLPWRRVLARGVVLSVRSAYEEVAWRGLVLGLLAPLGLPIALLASSVLFASAHVRRLGRRATVHLGTGLAFGGVYVSTGSLLAAIAAHATYNMVLGLALLAGPPRAVRNLSNSDNRQSRSGSLAWLSWPCTPFSSPSSLLRPLPSWTA